jgi:hypothetical protein
MVRGGAVIPAQTSHGPRVLKVWDTETIPTEGVPFSTDLCALAEVDEPATGKEDKTFYESIYACATPPRLIPRAKPRQP